METQTIADELTVVKSEKSRAKLYRRDPDRASLELQERDLEMIRCVYEHRFLTSEHLAALFGTGAYAAVAINRRLRKLYDQGYLDRPRAQAEWQGPGGRPVVHAIGNRGADLLAERFGIERTAVDWTENNRDAKAAYLWHTLMASNVWVTLALALRDHGRTSLGFWRYVAKSFDHVTLQRSRGNPERRPIRPDAFFRLDEAEDQVFFLLEAHRGTVPHSRMRARFRGYWGWWQQGGHRRLGIEAGFRVLTVTPTAAVRDNLTEVARVADDKRTGSAMFLFASETDFPLHDPGRILGPIWRTPADGGWHSLLE